MLYYLAEKILMWAKDGQWQAYVSPLRVFRHITFRSAGAAVTALLLSWVLGPLVIRWLKELKFGQEYRDRAEEQGALTNRVDKRGTPTMGGILIVLVVDLTALLWAQWNTLVQLMSLTFIVLC